MGYNARNDEIRDNVVRMQRLSERDARFRPYPTPMPSSISEMKLRRRSQGQFDLGKFHAPAPVVTQL
jgi:hypothetical protein